jgi:hypothetical protein
MFIRNVACRFGLPTSIISDQDPHFISDFWRAVSSYLKTRLAMSSSHHPQHNGQMEITNWTMETMLRAYTASQKDSLSEWLFMLEHAYNSNVHTSMGVSPYYLLYGLNPRSPLNLLTIDAQTKKPTYSLQPEANSFLSVVSPPHRLHLLTTHVRRRTATEADEHIIIAAVVPLQPRCSAPPPSLHHLHLLCGPNTPSNDTCISTC